MKTRMSVLQLLSSMAIFVEVKVFTLANAG
jgi:hypothetical protein